ncbi:MAG: hypothetical protein ACI4Q3_00225 [Kiritimatiellia bacterium]
MENTEEQTTLELAEERLRLEREAIALERERLATARAHAEAENKLARSSRRTPFAAASIVLLAALSFVGGLLTGLAIMENRQQRQREERLARALSQLDDLAGASSTNAPAGQQAGNAHPNVAVMVIQ